MIKSIKFFLVFILLNGCGYEPIILNNKYDYYLSKLTSEGDSNINKIIKKELVKKNNIESKSKYEIYISSLKEKEIISSNRKGDPTVYMLKINVEYNLSRNGLVILKNKILKQSTYNNINDKFELLKYEQEVEKNLSEQISYEIIMSINTLKE